MGYGGDPNDPEAVAAYHAAVAHTADFLKEPKRSLAMETRIDSVEADGKYEITFTARFCPADRQAFEQALACAASGAKPPEQSAAQLAAEAGATVGAKLNAEAWTAAIESARQEASELRRENNRLERELDEALKAVTEKSLEVEHLQAKIMTVRDGG